MRGLLFSDSFTKGTLQGLIAKCFPKKVAEDAAAERLFYERLGMENPRAGDKRGRSEETPIAPRHAAPSPAAPAAVAATSSVSAAAASSATASPRARPVSPGPERAAKKAARSESAGELRRAAPPAPAQQQQQQQSLTGLASPKPMKSSMKKTAPLSQAAKVSRGRCFVGLLFDAAKESAKEIRFRLSSPRDPRIAIDKRVIFNAPRDSALKKIVPFLQNWLAQNGHTGGQLKFLRDGAVVSGDRSFLSLYGPTAGTQKDPATLEFFFE